MKHSETLKRLENSVAIDFTALRKKYKRIDFYTQVEIEDCEFMDFYFDMMNDCTGRTDEIYILKIDEEGIHVRLTEEPNVVKHPIGLYDLASVEDRIALVELMQDRCDL